MKIKFIFSAVFIFILSTSSQAQSYVFGIKGGPSLLTQRWNNFDSGRPLLAYHGALFMESFNEENKSSIFAQAGFHTRGRSIVRRRFIGISGQEFPGRTFKSRHYNAGLVVGVKQKIPLGTGEERGFYGFGVRAEYNLYNDLGIYEGFEGSINKLTYGVTVNGGFEIPFSDFIGGIFEISIHPDLGKQIFVARQDGYVDPYTGVIRSIPEQNVINLSIEVSVGIKFLHKIIYVD